MRANFMSQLLYQRNSVFYGLALTETILHDIGINYSTEEKFLRFTGIRLKDFASLQLLIGGAGIAKPNLMVFKISRFKKFYRDFPYEVIERYMSHVSLDFPSLMAFLKDHHAWVKEPEIEFGLISPLTRKPFFRAHDIYGAFHPTLTGINIDYEIYDTLKQHDAEEFSREFGHGFEKYVNRVLSDLNLRVFEEAYLKKILKQDSTSDFGLKIGEDLVFIEAKSAEMNSLTVHNPQEKYLRRSLQNSVVKGYQQIFLSANAARQRKPTELTGNGTTFGIIVTFKPLFLGTPESIWQEFMEKIITETIDQNILNDNAIDPKNIFCLSAFEFDMLCAHCRTAGTDIASCLQKAVRNNESPATTKSMFQDHLENLNVTIDSYPHIARKFDEIMDRLRAGVED